MNPKPRSKKLLSEPTAISANPDLPPFIARPEGAPVYYGFPLIEETRIDGWCFGAITDFLQPDRVDGCTWGDAFIEAPDGSRAGIVWDTSVTGVEQISPPDPGRWGVWSVGFNRPIKTMDDLLFNLAEVLPLLQDRYRQIKSAQS
jgi:hypothetical protein